MSLRFLPIFCVFAASASAKIVPHALFTDHMVLQQGQTVFIWGTGEPEERVEVTFGDQRVATAAGSDGHWLVTLKPLSACAEPAVLRIDDVIIRDVLVGEVWVCSGQSNMAMAVGGTLDAESAVAQADAGDYGRIRLFKVPVGAADERQPAVDAKWQECDGESVSAFSATGFYFGRALQKALGVPVGLIQSAVGGTNAYSWISNDAFKNHPGAAVLRSWYEDQLAALPEATKRYEAALERHNEKVAAAKAAGKPLAGPAARAPFPPMSPENPKRPTCLYNAMIAPLQPYAVKGAVWYQGEANSRVPWAPNYDELMRALIESWRRDWNQPENRDFPFYVVQLPNYAKGDAWGWPVIRESMRRIWDKVPNTGMVVTIDAGDPEDIHPRNKTPVGERLAIFARGDAYGEQITYSGPVFKKMSVTGDFATLEFDHAGSGLASTDGRILKHFTIAGGNMVFVPAVATVEGDKLIVRSEKVRSPVAVRYAWLNNPEGANFGNKDGLPATPFRSDKGEIPPP